MTQTHENASTDTIAPAMTVLGLEYRLSHVVPQLAYHRVGISLTRTGDGWRAHVSTFGSATMMLGADGPTPEAALLALPEAYAAIDAARVRLTEAIELACGMRQEQAA